MKSRGQSRTPARAAKATAHEKRRARRITNARAAVATPRIAFARVAHTRWVSRSAGYWQTATKARKSGYPGIRVKVRGAGGGPKASRPARSNSWESVQY